MPVGRRPLAVLLVLVGLLTPSRGFTFKPHIIAGAAPAAPLPAHRALVRVRAGANNPAVDAARAKIQERLGCVELDLTATFDDPNGAHVAIRAVSARFEGLSRVKRQQLVYSAIWEEMQGPIHAVDSMVCKAPGED
jgi:BolA protein